MDCSTSACANFCGSIISGIATTGAKIGGASVEAASTAAGSAALNSDDNFSFDYFTDTLLRPENAGRGNDQNDSRKEVSTIFTRSIVQGELSTEDKNYLIGVIAQRTGVSEDEARARLQEVSMKAEKAIDDLEVQARKAADEARKAAAIFALWAFASLLVGAFVASLAATIGGKARDS